MNDDVIIWYLSGPMSNRPQFNFPVFDRAARALRLRGMEVISPHEQDSEETRAMAYASPDGAHTGQGESWGTCLSRDVKIIADVAKGIILLPKWWESRGARLEAFTALLCGHVFEDYDPETDVLLPAPKEVIREIIRRNMP